MLFRSKRGEDARMALEQMEGFELAGRTVRTAHFCWLFRFIVSLASREYSPRKRDCEVYRSRLFR